LIQKTNRGNFASKISLESLVIWISYPCTCDNMIIEKSED